MKATVVLPTPPFGAKTVRTREAAASALTWNAWWTAETLFIRSKPEKGIIRTAWIPRSGSGSIGCCGHGQDDHRQPDRAGEQLVDELEALDPALEQGVDDHDVGPQLADLAGGLRAVNEDVEQLDRALGVEQSPDVLGHLRHVFDEQEPDLVLGHRPTIPCARCAASPPNGPMARTAIEAMDGARSGSRARSPGPSGSRP